MQSLTIFPLFYLGPVSYFKAMGKAKAGFLIEREEHFVKQTYRNRAKIYSPNGPLDLIVPVIKGSKVHTKVKDVKISNESRWQRLHWRSLESCYRSSAYFEYYEDEFRAFFDREYHFLFDYNTELLTWLLKKLKRPSSLEFTSEYERIENPALDFRSKFSSKRTDSNETYKPYFQVFDDRHGFIPDLSIIDLLFNQGPQANLFI